MAKLRFLAVPTAHVPERHDHGGAIARPAEGGFMHYVGRKFDPEAAGDKYPITSTPYECDADTGEALYLARECREGCLKPADEATRLAVFGPVKPKPEPVRVSAEVTK